MTAFLHGDGEYSGVSKRACYILIHKLKETIYTYFNGTIKFGNSATNPDHHLLATYLFHTELKAKNV